MNILFYTPVNFRCRDIESLGKKFSTEGHKVFLLSQSYEGPLHISFSQMGLYAEGSQPISGNVSTKLFKRIWQLIRFCSRHKIRLLFSHLEPTNFIAVLAQHLIKARVVIYRHHIDIANLKGFDKSFTYTLTYALAKEVIAVSEEGRQFMITQEKVEKEKITHINLSYDFSLYDRPDNDRVQSIRRKYKADILLVSAGTLSSHKRPEVSLEVVTKLVEKKVDVVLLYLGKGEESDSLKKSVIANDLQNRVFFIGYTESIMDYLFAADWLIHPSISESSCVVVKEAALAELPVMVCRGVEISSGICVMR
jgi:glycosyltransferase involved in cell wall biosynthesis